MLDAFFSLVANIYFQHGLKFKYDDAIDFVLFSTITSNGCDTICEIVRILVESDAIFDWDTFDTKKSYSMKEPCALFRKRIDQKIRLYNVLCFFGNNYFDKGLGSCRIKRHIVCNKGQALPFTFNFLALKEELRTATTSCLNSSYNADDLFSKLLVDLDKKFDGFGPVVAHNFLQMASLIGILPLEMYNCATLDGKGNNLTRGPCKLIAKCLHGTQATQGLSTGKRRNVSSVKCEEVFNLFHTELSRIWKTSLSKSYIENVMCELWRSLPLSKKTSTERGHHFIKKCADHFEKYGFNRCNSKVKECIYFNRNRCRGRPVQALFRVVRNSASSTKLQMFQHVFIGKRKKHFVERCWIQSDREPVVGNGSLNFLQWGPDECLKLDENFCQRFQSKLNSCDINGCVLCSNAPGSENNTILCDDGTFQLSPVTQSSVIMNADDLSYTFDSKAHARKSIHRSVRKVDIKKKSLFEARKKMTELKDAEMARRLQSEQTSAIDLVPLKRKSAEIANGNVQSNLALQDYSRTEVPGIESGTFEEIFGVGTNKKFRPSSTKIKKNQRKIPKDGVRL